MFSSPSPQGPGEGEGAEQWRGLVGEELLSNSTSLCSVLFGSSRSSGFLIFLGWTMCSSVTKTNQTYPMMVVTIGTIAMLSLEMNPLTRQTATSPESTEGQASADGDNRNLAVKGILNQSTIISISHGLSLPGNLNTPNQKTSFLLRN